jgi:hypothetical protein
VLLSEFNNAILRSYSESVILPNDVASFLRPRKKALSRPVIDIRVCLQQLVRVECEVRRRMRVARWSGNLGKRLVIDSRIAINRRCGVLWH